MPRERPRIGDWNEEEAWAAFQGHIDNNEVTKADLKKLRPWNSTPWRSHKCKLSVGDAAPDSKIVTLDGEETSLSSVFDKDTRPVVLIFGSITCPSFRNIFLKEFCEIVAEQNGKVRLCVVYLAEAHPRDGWHLGTNDLSVEQHKTIEQRIAQAKELQKLDPELKEIVCDSIDNDSDQHYEALPSRVYVVHSKKIVFQSEVGPFQISPSSLQAFFFQWPLLAQQTNSDS